jgi:hypothetical protein
LVDPKTQRITIPACSNCNRGFSDDETHFHSVMLLAGESNELVADMWKGKAARRFAQKDGRRRVKDIVTLMKDVVIEGETRSLIYPADDPRVIRVVKKMVRGLCHFYELETAVPEDEVFVDVMRFQTPPGILADMAYDERDPQVARWWYWVDEGDEEYVRSAWLIEIYERTRFVATVGLSSE